MYSISLLVLTAHRPASLRVLLESVVASDDFPSVEVIVLMMGDEPSSAALLQQYHDAYPAIRYCAHPSCSRSEARNILIEEAQGEILYFLDDDVSVEKSLFNKLREKFARYPHVSIIGGPNVTPPESNMFQKTQGFVLGSFFGTLWIRQRYRQVGQDRLAGEWAFILCNLAVRRRVFLETPVRFSPSLSSAEENLLLQQLIHSGYQALYAPAISVFHQRRKSLLSFGRQIYSYGKGRFQIIRLRNPIRGFVYAIPFLVAACSVIGAAVLKERCIYFIAGYLTVDIVFSSHVALQARHGAAFFISVVLFPFLHFSYALGFLAGALSSPRVNRKQ